MEKLNILLVLSVIFLTTVYERIEQISVENTYRGTFHSETMQTSTSQFDGAINLSKNKNIYWLTLGLAYLTK